MFGTFVLNAFLSVSLNSLWGMINSLQIIAHLTDFVTYTPANVLMVNDMIQDLSNFDILPTEEVLEMMGLTHLNQ